MYYKKYHIIAYCLLSTSFNPNIYANKVQCVQHVVEEGDSLSNLSTLYGIKIKDIVLCNKNLNTKSNLYIDDTIYVPMNPRYQEVLDQRVLKKLSYKPSSEMYYKIKPGDTLYKIAKQHGLSVKMLKDINKYTTSTLHVGKSLIVGLKYKSQDAVEKKDLNTELKRQIQKNIDRINDIRSENNISTKSDKKDLGSFKKSYFEKAVNVDSGINKPQDFKFLKPSSGKIVSKFGKSENSSISYDGITVQIPQDDLKVRASKKGTVVYLNYNIKPYGQFLILEHGDDILTAYGAPKNAKIKVERGKTVEEGQEIIDYDDSNSANKIPNKKLFFAIRKAGTSMNPLTSFK